MLELLLRELCPGYKEPRSSPSLPFPAAWSCAGDFWHPPRSLWVAAFCRDCSLLFAVMGRAKCYLQRWTLNVKMLRTGISTQYPPHLIFLPTGVVISGCGLVFSISLTGIQLLFHKNSTGFSPVGQLVIYCTILCVCADFSVFCCSGAVGLCRTACKSRQIVKAEACENNTEMGFKRKLECVEGLCGGIKEENRGL